MQSGVRSGLLNKVANRIWSGALLFTGIHERSIEEATNSRAFICPQVILTVFANTILFKEIKKEKNGEHLWTEPMYMGIRLIVWRCTCAILMLLTYTEEVLWLRTVNNGNGHWALWEVKKKWQNDWVVMLINSLLDTKIIIITYGQI